MWEKQAEQFVVDLKRRHISGSFNVAKQTLELLRLVCSSTRWSNAKSLMDILTSLGKRLIESQPLEFTIGNIVRRVLFVVREDYISLKKTMKLNEASGRKDQAPSLYNMLGSEDFQEDFTDPIRELKASVIEAINELLEEIKNLYRNVADQAIEHIHSNEVVMTFGRSRTVQEFLKSAARKRKFEVVVAESAPSLEGQQAALELAQAGISTTLISDAAIFAMMARVNKVIVGTHAVMANGGLIAISGTHMLAVAAKHYSVPLMVCTGLYKLSPLYPYDQDTFNDIVSPGSIIKFEDADRFDNVHVESPGYDYIPPELVDLFVTNLGGHNPSYIYRLLVEFYNPEDTLEI